MQDFKPHIRGVFCLWGLMCRFGDEMERIV